MCELRLMVPAGVSVGWTYCSNVGAALQGRIGEVPDEVLRKSF